jgi:hypothetical protein
MRCSLFLTCIDGFCGGRGKEGKLAGGCGPWGLTGGGPSQKGCLGGPVIPGASGLYSKRSKTRQSKYTIKHGLQIYVREGSFLYVFSMQLLKRRKITLSANFHYIRDLNTSMKLRNHEYSLLH